MECECCGRDIDALGQDNMSYAPGHPLCEDCFAEKQSEKNEEELL